MTGQADVGVTGLAVMGRNLARNLARRGNVVALHNRTAARTHEVVQRFGDEGEFVGTDDLRSFVAALRRPRRIIVMVKAGAPTDAVLDELVPLLDDDDIVVDAGNAHYADTRRREQALRERGVHFVGTGVSGGEEGALDGPSIMPGGPRESYADLGPLLESIAARVDGEPCCTWIGPDAAGHFAKMVHNGIEYADMQLIAEAYDILRTAGGLEPAELAEVFASWNTGDLDSFLVQITAEVLRQVDVDTGRALVDVIEDVAEQKGTGRWTVQNALELGVPTDTIAAAVFARSASSRVALRAEVREVLRPPAAPTQADRDQLVDDVRDALWAAKVVSYAQGLEQLRAASDELGWDVDVAAVARIWRGGCIIRARLLERIRNAFSERPDLPSLLADPGLADDLARAQPGWRRVIGLATAHGVPVPGLSAALAAHDTLTRPRLPSSLVQGLRDYFGAHTYHRVDRPGTFHTRWSEDRREEQQ